MTGGRGFVDTSAWFAYVNAGDPDHRRAIAVGRTLLDPATVEWLRVTPVDERAAWALFERRPDKSYSFTDCTSFVLMRRERIGDAIALDEHFAQEGFTVAPR